MLRLELQRSLQLLPRLLGGPLRVGHWVNEARRYGIKPVFSAAFESGVGMRHLVALAGALGDEAVPAGFDTYRWLAEDVLAPRLALDVPVLDVEAFFRTPRTLCSDVLIDA